jgi:hypothetical protein
MNPSDVARLLITITVLDPRLNPPSQEDAKARVAAWALVLDDDLPVDEAERIVVAHYRESVKGIMPADVNRHWRIIRASRAESSRASRIRDERRMAEMESVPMPQAVRDAIRAIESGTEVDHDA